MDFEFSASIEKVSVSVREREGVVRRTCTITLAREFDHLIADVLGPGAKRIQDDIASRDIEKAVLAIDALIVSGKLKTLETDGVEIPLMRGTKATAKVGKDDDDPPSVSMVFEFEFSDDVWVFLGRNVASFASVTLSRLQQSFSFATTASGMRSEA